jgi:O-antigen ligase
MIAHGWRIGALLAVSVAVVMLSVLVSRQPMAVAAIVGLTVLVGLAAIRFETLTLLMIGSRTAVELAHTGADQEPWRLSVVITGAYTLAAVVWLVERGRRGSLRLSPVSVGAVAVTAAAVLAGLLSEQREEALLGASRWVFLTVFIVALESLVTDDRAVRRLLVAVGGSTLFPLAIGTWQLVTGGGRLVDGISRVDGSFAHPNTYGFYLVTMALSVIAIGRQLPVRYRVTTSLLGAALIVNLLATYSRTSYVAFAAGLIVISVTGRRWWLLMATAGAIVAAPFLPVIADRFADIGDPFTVRGTAGNSLAWRIEYWQEVLRVGEGRRVTGLGLGLVSEVTAQGREPHNDFLRAFVEMGAIGLVAYTALLVAIGRQARLALLRSSPAVGPAGIPHALAVAFAGVLAAYLVGSLTGNLMTQLVLLWYVLALAVASGLPARRPDTAPDRALAGWPAGSRR